MFNLQASQITQLYSLPQIVSQGQNLQYHEPVSFMPPATGMFIPHGVPAGQYPGNVTCFIPTADIYSRAAENPNNSMPPHKFEDKLSIYEPFTAANGQVMHKLITAPIITVTPQAKRYLGPRKRRFVDVPDNGEPYIKKPLNAYMLFLIEQRPFVKEVCQITQSSMVNRCVGDMWNTLTPDEKDKYYEKAKALALCHSKQHPKWSVSDNYGKKRKTRGIKKEMPDEAQDKPSKCVVPTRPPKSARKPPRSLKPLMGSGPSAGPSSRILPSLFLEPPPPSTPKIPPASGLVMEPLRPPRRPLKTPSSLFSEPHPSSMPKAPPSSGLVIEDLSNARPPLKIPPFPFLEPPSVLCSETPQVSDPEMESLSLSRLVLESQDFLSLEPPYVLCLETPEVSGSEMEYLPPSRFASDTPPFVKSPFCPQLETPQASGPLMECSDPLETETPPLCEFILSMNDLLEPYLPPLSEGPSFKSPLKTPASSVVESDVHSGPQSEPSQSGTFTCSESHFDKIDCLLSLWDMSE